MVKNVVDGRVYCSVCKTYGHEEVCPQPHGRPIGVGGSAPRAPDNSVANFGGEPVVPNPATPESELDLSDGGRDQFKSPPGFGRVVDPWTALRAARQQLITLGGDPRNDPNGDTILGVILDLIDESLR